MERRGPALRSMRTDGMLGGRLSDYTRELTKTFGEVSNNHVKLAAVLAAISRDNVLPTVYQESVDSAVGQATQITLLVLNERGMVSYAYVLLGLSRTFARLDDGFDIVNKPEAVASYRGKQRSEIQPQLDKEALARSVVARAATLESQKDQPRPPVVISKHLKARKRTVRK